MLEVDQLINFYESRGKNTMPLLRNLIILHILKDYAILALYLVAFRGP